MTHKTLSQLLLSGGIWAISGRVGSAIAAVTLNALLARLLSPDEMGAYFLTLSFVSIFAAFSQIGLNHTVVRLIPASIANEMNGRAIATIRIAFSAVLICSFVTAGAVYLGIGTVIARNVLHSTLITTVMGLASIWIIILAFQSLLAETFRGLHEIKFAVLFGGLFNSLITIFLFGIFWVLQGNASLDKILICSIIGGLTSNLIALALLQLKTMPPNGEGSITTNEVMKIAWPLLITNLTVLVLTQVDIWIVGLFLTQADVALYGAAARLAQVMMLTTSLLYAFMPPIIASLYAKKDKQKLQALLRAGAFANLVVVSPLVGLFFFFSSSIVELIYGPYYTQGHMVLSILTIGLLVNVATGIRGYVLMMCGFERTQMVISAIGGGLNVVACTVGALHWGITGVAFGAMLSLSFGCFVELIFVKRRIDIWTHASFQSFMETVRRTKPISST